MKTPKFLKKKRNIWIIAIIAVIIIGFFIFVRKNNSSSIQTGFATKQNLEETVLSTGQVISGTDLDLSFQGSGIVRQVLVSEGDKVYAGKVLAVLDQASAKASLLSAQGALAQAQANYEKLINGASAGDIQALQDVVTVAKTNLNNTYNSSLNTLNTGYAAIYNVYTTVTSIQNNYFSLSDQEGIKVNDNRTNIYDKMVNVRSSIDTTNGTNNIDAVISNLINNLNNVLNSVRVVRDQCDLGIYYSKVSVADKTSLDTQKTAVTTAISNINTLQSSIASYKVSLQTAENALFAKLTKPRQEDVDLANAQALSAQGQVAAAEAVLSNLTLLAPANGTITSVDIKVGEQATAMSAVMVLQNISDLHAEANVSEANIASLQVGQSINYTFDALGPDKHFAGKVLTINQASIVISGVVNYKVTGSLENIPDIKPGMTANMTIMIAKKDNASAVPSTAVINKNDKQYVRVINDPQKKTYHEVEVQTGMQADGGLVEIISGLNEGQEIVTYMK